MISSTEPSRFLMHEQKPPIPSLDDMTLPGCSGNPSWLQEVESRMGTAEFQALLRTIVLQTFDPITVQDAELRYVWVLNPHRGFPRDTRMGCTDQDLFEREEAERISAIKRQVLASGRAAVVETSLIATDGERKFLAGHLVPWISASNETKGLIGYFHDVTRRHQTEQELQRVVDDLNESQRIARIGTYRFDLRDETWSCTSTMDDILGLSPDFKKQGLSSWEALLHPEEREDVLRFFTQDVLQHGLAFDREYRAIRPNDGAEIWVHGLGKLEHDAEEHIITMFGTVQDITERKRTLEKLRISEERFRLAQKATNDAIWDWDATTQSKIWSEAGLAGFGWGGLGAETNSLDWWASKIHPEDRARVMSHFEFSVVDPKIDLWSDEYRFMKADGSFANVMDRAIALRSPSGLVLRVVGAMRDVTDTKRTQNALKLANEHLMASDRRKDAFLAMLSHELRNPLAPVHNSLEILKRTSARGELAERALAVLNRQVDHLTHMVNDLLDVTRIVRGKVVLNLESLDLCENVRDVVLDHRSVFTDKSIDLELTMEPGPLWIQGDRTRIFEIIGNLLTNAAKFTPSGGKTEVCLTSDKSTQNAILRIRDTGQGISAELLPYLFDPFVQADRTLERSAGGLGLGLSVVKGLVELHGGSIRVHSEGTGKGTAFTLMFPLEETRSTGNSTEDEKTPLIPHRILIIEDNVDAAHALKDLLSLLGMNAELAFTGPTGLEKARVMVPIVIFCDIGLPGIDGYEVARRIRSHPELNNVRLVAMSGYANDDDVARALESGFDAHLAKPASLKDLEEELRLGTNNSPNTTH